MPKLLVLTLTCFVVITGCSRCHKTATIKFNYTYDATKETLDTTQSGNAWYLPIQQRFVDFHNSLDTNRKNWYLIDPVSSSGIFYAPQHLLYQKLPLVELPDESKYYVDVASEGVGFEGYAIVTFLRVSNGNIEIDGSYGTFANNSSGDYSLSYYHPEKTDHHFNDSIESKNAASLPPNGIGDEYPVRYQHFDSASLAALRDRNTLFFGLVPPAVVKHALSNPGANIVKEFTPEEYEYRLLMIKTSFGTNVKKVDEQYLYTEFQNDWRFLINRATYDISGVRDGNYVSFLLNTGSYPSNEGATSKEQFLFPNLDIQYHILNAGLPVFSYAFDTDIPNFLLQASQASPASQPLYDISENNSLTHRIIGRDSEILTFDTGDLKTSIKPVKKTVLGTGMTLLCYVGQVSNGMANGQGELYFGWKGTDTAAIGYSKLTGRFKDGKLNGRFEYTVRDVLNHSLLLPVANGEYKNGALC